MLKRSDAVGTVATAFVVLFAGLLLVQLIIGVLAAENAQVVGTLTYEPGQLPDQSYQVGDFRIEWRQEGGGSLCISHQERPGFALWSTLPGDSFVSAGLADVDVREQRGHFRIQSKLQVACPDQSIESIESGEASVTVRGSLTCRDGAETQYELVLESLAPNQLGFRLTVDEQHHNRAYLTYASEYAEHFYGFGEQFSTFDLKGRRIPIFIGEQGIGRGLQPLTLVANLQFGVGGDWYSSYAAVPHYITSQLRSLFLENDECAVFDMRFPDRVQIQVHSSRMSGRILYGESPRALIAEYTSYAGRMRPLPDWVHEGAIISLQGGTERVRQVLALLEEQKTPITAVWLQDWVGQRTTSFGKQLWWNWELDAERYPDWNGLRAELNAQDIRLLTYVNPFVTDVAAKTNANRQLYAEASDQGYLVKNDLGTPYLVENSDFSAGLVDLSNPAACDWMRDVITEELIGIGVDGWMADFGEGLPFDAKLASGEPADAFHNRYAEAWAQLNREALDAQPNSDEMFFFMRSGYRRSPMYSTAFWLGDQLVSWDAHDGIKTAVTGLLSGGISGYSLNHSDIGGYTSVSHPVLGQHRSDELLKRWMELNAFTAIYRTHESNRPEENVQVYSSQELLEHFDRFARVYRAWAFYREQLVQEAAMSGMPVVRHMFLHYPSDPQVYDISYEQFLVGDEFIVAPVLDPGKTDVTAYLPKGRWVHLWTGETYGAFEYGEKVTVEAPIGQPGVFYREGSPIAAQFLANLRAEGVIQ